MFVASSKLTCMLCMSCWESHVGTLLGHRGGEGRGGEGIGEGRGGEGRGGEGRGGIWEHRSYALLKLSTVDA